MADPLKTGLVLSGGGARGAYEVGVLKYIREELGGGARFDVYSGSSVGAINAAFMAARADKPETQVQDLEKVWLELQIGKHIKYGLLRLLRLPLLLFGRVPVMGEEITHVALGESFFDTQELTRLVHGSTTWHHIADNLRGGHFHALSVTATDVHTGNGTVFVMKQGELAVWSSDPRSRAVVTTIQAQHVLASAAIPFFFPLVVIAGKVYCDGGMRQTTPIGPALRLGADRLFVVRLKAGKEKPVHFGTKRAQPSPAFLVGKMFNALFLDQLDYDLDRLDRINTILAAGEKAFGSVFYDRLADVTEAQRGMAWRRVDTLIVEPSQDLGRIAAQLVRDKTWRKGLPWTWRLIMAYLDSGRPEESDLLSYLLFDRGYTSRLIELGYEDAKSHREKICRFFEGAGHKVACP
ncbi:MAG: patatin-like phospholipase family protein [Bdellovibrionota bacterium]